MNYVQLQAELSDRLAAFSSKIAMRCAQGLTDAPTQAEDLVAGLLRELLSYRNLRNANQGGRNFPGVDLVDDERHLAVQVTAETSLDKIKSTIETIIRHNVHERYPDLRIFVLTTRQQTYSQPAIDRALGGRMKFAVNDHTWDFRDLLRMSTHAGPIAYRRALDTLDAYETGALDAFTGADFDPPMVVETVEFNLIELYLPQCLYVADLLDPPKQRRDARKQLRQRAETLGKRLPSDFSVFEGKIVTFYDLESDRNPFEGLYDRGTATRLGVGEFWAADTAQENLFKSLLRLCLQEQLYKRHVRWVHDEKIFAFFPLREDLWSREETWVDRKTSTRNVVLYKVSKKDPNKGGYRHLAFEADFLRDDTDWFLAIRPDWYFTTNPDYRPSPIAADLKKGIKRLENNKSVEQHFRFLANWLRGASEGDLLTQRTGYLSFGDIKTFSNHPALDDGRWIPFKYDAPEVNLPNDFLELIQE